MGIHQKFTGCMVRMGCDASYRTTRRYELNHIDQTFRFLPSTVSVCVIFSCESMFQNC